MAYRITYQWNLERKLSNKPPSVRPAILATAVLCAAAALRLLVPELSEALRALIYPLADPETVAAFSQMVESIGSGMSIKEAVTAFCYEILSYAG